MPERPQRLIDRDANRRAVQFTQRDDVRDFARSGIGQNYHRMMDLQRQKDPNLQDLKQSRRQWNRYDKYNAGRMLDKSPTEMQDMFMRDTETFRQRNKPAYNEMYPITGKFMDIAEKGGLWGSLLSELAGKTKKKVKDFVAGDGITSLAAGDTKADKERYITETFGPHLEDVPYGGPPPYEYEGPRPHEGMPTFPDIYRGPEPHRGLPPLDVYEGPRPHEGIPLHPGTAPIEDVEISDLPDEPLRVQGTDWVDDITETDTMPGSPFFPGNLLNLFKKDKEIPGYGTTYIDMEEPDERYEDYIERGEEPPAITPFDDSNREAGIASLYGQGPQWGSTNRRYEDEYRDHIARTGERMTYEEFEGAWERAHQGRPHAGLR
jgi:hypothetical protein